MIYTFKNGKFLNNNYESPHQVSTQIIDACNVFFNGNKYMNNFDCPFDIIGEWNQEYFEKTADIYYIIICGHIAEFIVCNNIYPEYLFNYGGLVAKCTPEEGDVIYSTKEEADKELEFLNNEPVPAVEMSEEEIAEIEKDILNEDIE